MKKAEKTIFVQNLTEELKNATSVVLVDYSGLTVKMQQDLKKRLKAIDARMEIVKNTLFKIAGKEAKISDGALSDTVLTGQTALVISEGDPIAPLQVLYKFAKEFEIPQFKVGVVEENFQDKASLEILSKLPSKEVLFEQVVGAIASPLYGVVGVLNANMQKLLYILKTKAEMR